MDGGSIGERTEVVAASTTGIVLRKGRIGSKGEEQPEDALVELWRGKLLAVNIFWLDAANGCSKRKAEESPFPVEDSADCNTCISKPISYGRNRCAKK